MSDHVRSCDMYLLMDQFPVISEGRLVQHGYLGGLLERALLVNKDAAVQGPLVALPINVGLKVWCLSPRMCL
jgi:hypothetical protein